MYRNTTDTSNSSGSSTVPVAAQVTSLLSEEQPSTSGNSCKLVNSVNTMMTPHIDNVVSSDVVTDTVTMVSSSSPVNNDPLTIDVMTNGSGIEQQGSGTIEQQDMLSVALFTSSSSSAGNIIGISEKKISPAVNIVTTQQEILCNQLLEESPTPDLQQDAPMHCSTPDKMMQCGSLETKHMSRSPSIPLQNTSMKMAKVDVTPVALPQRMIALEGLYPEDSTDSDHSHDSLDLFDDPVITSSQSKNDQNLMVIGSPLLFTADQQHSSVPPHHVDNNTGSVMDSLPSLSPALVDSISTQVNMII